MKKFFKWVFIVFGLIIVGGVIASMGDDSSSSTNSNDAKPASTAPKDDKSKKVTKEQFDQVKTGDTVTGEGGMTLEEVEAILGKGEKLSESQSGDLKMEFYQWNAEGEFGANVTVDFVNGKASSKAQFGME